MAPTTKQAPRLTDEQVAEVFRLLKGSDSLELKLTVPESDQRSAVAALDMDPIEAQIRQVYFFDTPDLKLNQAGVVVRGRRVQGRAEDTVVKLRPVEPDEISARLRALPDMGVEVDAMPGGYVCSASLKRTLKEPRVRDAAAGRRPIHTLFSKDQRKFFAEHAPSGVELDDLTPLGPIFVLKLKMRPGGLDRKLVAELWMYPDNSRILELSTKCKPNEAAETVAATRVFLEEQGIDLSGEQQTKTKTALQYFTSNLA